MRIWRWLLYGDNKGLEQELEQEKVRTFNLTSQVVEHKAKITALTKRIENCDRLATEAEQDYNDMRGFQQKFITADKQREALMKENHELSVELLKYRGGMREVRAWFRVGTDGLEKWFDPKKWLEQEPPGED